MQPDAWVAPARYPLTVLHRQDPYSVPGEDGAGEPTIGRAVCGLLMAVDELWMPVEARDGDQFCTGCMPRGGTPVRDQGEMEALF